MSSNDDWYGPTSETVKRVSGNPDVFVRNEGSIFLFQPLTERAKTWIGENVGRDAHWFEDALVVEHRYAIDLATAMRDAGLVLA